MKYQIRWWPKSLASRLMLILFLGLILADSLMLGLLLLERNQSSRAMMANNLKHDVMISVAILDKLSVVERGAWVKRLERNNIQYLLRTEEYGMPLKNSDLNESVKAIKQGLENFYSLRLSANPENSSEIIVHLRLTDRSPLTIYINPRNMPFASWLPFVLIGQFILLFCSVWFGVYNAINPLVTLTQAVENLNPDRTETFKLSEEGPLEVRKAACAYNAMQDRISKYLKERLYILAAINHDLQTPITRIRLRLEMMENTGAKCKLLQDIDEIARLVREGVAYARSSESHREKNCLIQLNAFIDSLVCDYQDTGQQVTLYGELSGTYNTKPQALRRILSNIIDNAIKFSGSAEVEVRQVMNTIIIEVRDRGPGIPPEELIAVLQPFYRVENSRNRNTGGAGLGLAITQQLVASLDGELTLINRKHGGLCVRVSLRI